MTIVSDTYLLIAPCWTWMLPLIAPLLWWLWCPPGRPIPRLTIRRLLTATAGLSLIFGVPAAFVRSSAADRALMTLAGFGGEWTYGPDPAGSARPVITEVKVGSRSGQGEITDADVPRIATALAQFPHLRSLKLDAARTSAAGIAALVTNQPNLEQLEVPDSNADDTVLAQIQHNRQLRELNLDETQITDAGLVYLANHPTLEVLRLKDVSINEAGLMHLTGLPKLKKLILTHWRYTSPHNNPSPITDDALKRLADSLPAFEFLRSPDNRLLVPGRSRVPPGSDPP